MSEKVNAPEISVKNVSMVFLDSKGNPVQALKNVSIDIQKGEFISLLGPSGCGKSTLLRIVSDLLTPTSGEVTVCGKTPRETRLEQKFGIVFQNPVLLDWRTVGVLSFYLMGVIERAITPAKRKAKKKAQ